MPVWRHSLQTEARATSRTRRPRKRQGNGWGLDKRLFIEFRRGTRKTRRDFKISLVWAIGVHTFDRRISCFHGCRLDENESVEFICLNPSDINNSFNRNSTSFLYVFCSNCISLPRASVIHGKRFYIQTSEFDERPTFITNISPYSW